MIIGAYYLTETGRGRGRRGPRRSRRSTRPSLAHELRGSATSRRALALHARIKVRMPAVGSRSRSSRPARSGTTPRAGSRTRSRARANQTLVLRRSGSNGDGPVLVETTLGPAPVQRGVPARLRVPRRAGARSATSPRSSASWSSATRRRWWPTSLDKLKDLGFEYATRAGSRRSRSPTCSTPAARPSSSSKFEDEADKVESQYDRGIITDDERRQKEIEIWTEATNQVP